MSVYDSLGGISSMKYLPFFQYTFLAFALGLLLMILNVSSTISRAAQLSSAIATLGVVFIILFRSAGLCGSVS